MAPVRNAASWSFILGRSKRCNWLFSVIHINVGILPRILFLVLLVLLAVAAVVVAVVVFIVVIVIVVVAVYARARVRECL